METAIEELKRSANRTLIWWACVRVGLNTLITVGASIAIFVFSLFWLDTVTVERLWDNMHMLTFDLIFVGGGMLFVERVSEKVTRKMDDASRSVTDQLRKDAEGTERIGPDTDGE